MDSSSSHRPAHSHPRRHTDISVMRSSQVDASRLDEELGLLLREQFVRAFALFRPGTIARYHPELMAFLEFLILRYSVLEGRPLPGMALMNLRHRNDPATTRNNTQKNIFLKARGLEGRSGMEGPGLSLSQRWLYVLGAVGLRYAWTKAGRAMSARNWADGGNQNANNGVVIEEEIEEQQQQRQQRWKAQVWRAFRGIENAYSALSLINLLDFLRSGRYRSVLERALGARLVYTRTTAQRAINYEYLNRQLVWSELSEVLLFLLPLVSAPAVKKALRSVLPRLPAPGQRTTAAGATIHGGSTTCGVCGTQDVLTPYTAEPCGHIFCYFCLRSNVLADDEFQCPMCLEHVEAMRPCCISSRS